MTEYIPTLDEVRDKYADARVGIGEWTRFDESVKQAVESAYAEFDRMIASVERAAAARALEEAADDIESRRNEPGLVHLDVRYAGYYTGIRSGMESDSKALRVRAAEIRGGERHEVL